MHEHDTKRSASVYAVLVIAVVLVTAMLWLGFRQSDLPILPPGNQLSGRHGAGEDILPAIVLPLICEDERPCS